MNGWSERKGYTMICDKESKTTPISHVRRAERLRPEITEGNWLAPPPPYSPHRAGFLFPYRWKLCHVFRAWKGIANCFNGIRDELTTFWLSSFKLITSLSPFSRSLAKPRGFNYSAWKRERSIFVFPTTLLCNLSWSLGSLKFVDEKSTVEGGRGD